MGNSSNHNHTSITRDEKPIRFLFENSAFLILGTLIALVWVNSSEYGSRTHEYFFKGFNLGQMFDPDGHASTHDTGESQTEDHSKGHALTWEFVINDILMALFFAIAAKEVWESMLPGGSLSKFRTAAMPLVATAGGVVGPALLFLFGAILMNQYAELGRGWAVPCATDIAFSYLIGRLIFGNGHPAIAFLLLLAIADDAAGLVIIALFYPKESPELIWLLLSVGGMVIGYLMARMKVQSFWWYLLLPGVMSWFGFYWSHIHPALGLVPIVLVMPHAKSDAGIFARSEFLREDTLNEFEHWWKNPVELILGLFGLCNAGVAFSTIGIGTWLVLIGLVIGKPLGITLCTYFGEKFFGLSIPRGMDYRDVFTVGCVAGIGFTVALFVSTAAFKDTDPNLDPIKMGALLSFSAAIVSLIVARILGVKNWKQKVELLASNPEI